MKQKIVHLIHEGSGGGGATLSLTYFHRYAKQFDTFVICGCKGDLAERLRKQNLKVYDLHLDRPIPCLLSIPQLVMILLDEKPHASIVHGQWGGFCGAVASWLARVPKIIYYTHMPSFYTDWDFMRIIRNRFVELVTCGIASKVVCPSQANRYQYLLRNLVDEEKIIHIPNGIDTHQVQPVEEQTPLRRELKLPTDKKVVVSVGRLEDQKRVDWLVKAWATVEKHRKDVELHIVGDGSEKNMLKSLAKKQQLQHCHFLGRRPNGYKYFQAADLAVMTTMFEAQPYSLLEALACGCPVVGTAADGVLETLTPISTDLLSPVGSPEQLGEQILKCLANEDQMNSYREKLLAHVRTTYPIEKISQRQIKVLSPNS